MATYNPGDILETFVRGEWHPCIVLKIAKYVGRSGPGYYAAPFPYDPSREFWTCDRFLRVPSNAA